MCIHVHTCTCASIATIIRLVSLAARKENHTYAGPHYLLAHPITVKHTNTPIVLEFSSFDYLPARLSFKLVPTVADFFLPRGFPGGRPLGMHLGTSWDFWRPRPNAIYPHPAY